LQLASLPDRLVTGHQACLRPGIHQHQRASVGFDESSTSMRQESPGGYVCCRWRYRPALSCPLAGGRLLAHTGAGAPSAAAKALLLVPSIEVAGAGCLVCDSVLPVQEGPAGAQAETSSWYWLLQLKLLAVQQFNRISWLIEFAYTALDRRCWPNRLETPGPRWLCQLVGSKSQTEFPSTVHCT
jgi:hypothetical protein